MQANVNRFIEEYIHGRVSAFGSESAPMVTLIMGAMLMLGLPFDFRVLLTGSELEANGKRPFYVVYRVGMSDTEGWDWDEYETVPVPTHGIVTVTH